MNIPKITKICYFLTKLFQKKVGILWNTVCSMTTKLFSRYQLHTMQYFLFNVDMLCIYQLTAELLYNAFITIINYTGPYLLLPSVLGRCRLGSRKGIRPEKKTERWGADVVIFVERGADLHMFQLMPLLLTAACFSKIQIGFTFLVPAQPGCPLEKRPLNGCGSSSSISTSRYV